MKKILACLTFCVVLLVLFTACTDNEPPSETDEGKAQNTSVSWLSGMQVRGNVKAIDGNEITLEIYLVSTSGIRDTVEPQENPIILIVTDDVKLVSFIRGAGGATEAKASFSDIKVGGILFVTYSQNAEIEQISVV